MRYSPDVVSSYDAEFDVVPRAALVFPPFVLAFIFNKVVLIIEILHQFSLYLESMALIPQFVLLYKRQKYELWVLLFTICMGAETLLRNLPLLSEWREKQVEDPYNLCAAFVQAIVFVGGLAALGIRHYETKSQEGLNEVPNKPAFDEEWEAGKFEFQVQKEDPVAGTPAASGSTRVAH
ncbi:hypothetical protein CEUSTIGMA_g12273.t1 [Chlamydomonas eustigma]|uniref:Uncharacterized protein n=1 Tax=Chlamydomonas eustigma TaxID=1157962 RepID=A0A250XPK0_9CHLO|nr:hypothetical protein CEUSTIGMA_g12273.t1 [Chlamydomonas eustigma]|eukprot:GAX84852.1 hypothetical protein CEUSTIGMA_g12273.t1 [Chlamydomonas eustigma]